jgi:hypothetical protein
MIGKREREQGSKGSITSYSDKKSQKKYILLPCFRHGREISRPSIGTFSLQEYPIGSIDGKPKVVETLQQR